ncbi:MAG: 50S ribosomal protein L28 [Hydrogenobaculum sp.]|jgi:large subunit ribosomal protein L28
MAACFVCNKKAVYGKSVTFSAERNSRVFKPNLQSVKIRMPDGSAKRVMVCTKCLKAGKVLKAV